MRIFNDYSGYVQTDAKSVFNILFRDPALVLPVDPEIAPDGAARREVGCMAHGRRKLFECAVTTKSEVAREALLRIHRLYEYEVEWRSLSAEQRKEKRQRS